MYSVIMLCDGVYLNAVDIVLGPLHTIVSQLLQPVVDEAASAPLHFNIKDVMLVA